MLEIRPTHLKPAREFVGKYHRHNIPPVGGKFAISCFEGERLCGVAICGRPTARKLDDGAPPVRKHRAYLRISDRRHGGRRAEREVDYMAACEARRAGLLARFLYAFGYRIGGDA